MWYLKKILNCGNTMEKIISWLPADVASWHFLFLFYYLGDWGFLSPCTQCPRNFPLDKHFLCGVQHLSWPEASWCMTEFLLHLSTISWTIQARKKIQMLHFYFYLSKQSVHLQMTLTLTLPNVEKEKNL